MMPPSPSSHKPLALLYLGRRGSIPRFVLELGRALNSIGVDTGLLLSQHIEEPAGFEPEIDGAHFLPVFQSGIEALAVWRAREVADSIETAMRAWQAEHVIEVMPHLWSPLIAPVWRALGVEKTVVVHDVVSHPGDPSAIVTPWLVHGALSAERIITLSEHCKRELLARHPVARGKTKALFHPDVPLGPAAALRASGGPLRVLMMGRLYAYKGVDLFVEAVERARGAGVDIQPIVRGAGPIKHLGARLKALDADVDNRWQSDADLARALASAHVVVAPYLEASQSGVVSAAFAAGRPVIATPVGALPEQVRDRRTGLVAKDCSAAALANCLAEMARDKALLRACANGVAQGAEARAMAAFAQSLIRTVRDAGRGQSTRVG